MNTTLRIFVRNSRSLIFWVSLCLPLPLLAQAPAVTQIQDTVYKSDGSLASGSVVITWQSFITADHKPVFGGSKTIPLTNGALSVSLVPTSGATPAGVTYDVKYYQSGGVSYQETWVVPSSSNPVSLSQVRTAAAPSGGSVINAAQVNGTAVVEFPTITQTIVSPSTAGVVPLRLKGNPTANANVLEIYDSQATPVLQGQFDPSGALLLSNAPTFSTMTQGSLEFAGPGGLLSQDNTNLFWDNINKKFMAGSRTGFSALTQSYLGENQNNFGSLNRFNGSINTTLGFTAQDNSTNDGWGILGVLESNHTSGTRGNAIAVEADAYHTGAGGTVSHLIGLNGTVTGSAGTVTLAAADESSMSIPGSTVTDAAMFDATPGIIVNGGTVTNTYGMRLGSNSKSGVGTITNNYGIKIEDQAGVGGTGNWAIKTGTGKVAFGDAVTAPNIGSVRYAAEFPGADPGAKIAAAIADLPATGGSIDASGLDLTITNTTDFLTGVTKHLVLQLGCGTLNTITPLTIDSSPMVIWGCSGMGGTTIKYTGADITGNAKSPVIYVSTNYAELHNILLDSNGLTKFGLQTNSSGYSTFDRITVKNPTIACFEAEFEVPSQYTAPVCSTSATSMATVPTYGINVTGVGPNSSGGIIIENARMEGLNYGAFIGSSTNVQLIGGVYENNQYGIDLTPAASNVTLNGVDVENNSVRDVLDGSTGSVWEGATIAKGIHGVTVDSTATNVSIQSGFYNTGIEVRAGAVGTYIGAVSLPTGASISDSGTNTQILGYKINNVPQYSSLAAVMTGPRTGFTALTQSYAGENQNNFGAINPFAGSINTVLGVSSQDSGTASGNGLIVQVESANPSGTRGEVTGIEADSYHTGAGTLNVLNPFTTYAEIDAGTVNNIQSLVVSTPAKNGGTVTNNYGLFMQNQAGVATNNWAIKTGTGLIEFGDQVKSDVATGTAPFVIASTTLVPNLNSDLLDGLHASSFEQSANKNAASGYAGLDSSTKLSASQLPNPSATTLGGVESKDCTGTGHVLKINSDGTVTCSADSGGGAVTSVFGRTGTVAAVSGDYTAAQVTNAFDKTAANTLTNVTSPSTPSTGNTAIYVDSTNKVLSSKNDAGVVSNAVVPDSGASHNFLTAISASGIISKAQPAIADLSDSASVVQTNRSISTTAPLAGGGDLSANRTLSITGAAGQILAGAGPAFTAAPTLANSAAPSSPSAGNVTVYTDSTDLRLHDKNANGTIGTTVVADSGAANNFLTGVSAAGVISKAQPAFSNLSGSASCGQLPALTGVVTSSAGSCATTAASIVTAFTTFCTGGSIAASSTVFLPGYGGVATTCTGLGTTRTSGMAVSAGTIKNLRVNMGTGGKANDKVTVEIAGVASALTCTYGTGTSCSDTTHTATVTAGQVLTIAVSTGASDGTANLSVYFELVN